MVVIDKIFWQNTRSGATHGGKWRGEERNASIYLLLIMLHL